MVEADKLKFYVTINGETQSLFVTSVNELAFTGDAEIPTLMRLGDLSIVVPFDKALFNKINSVSDYHYISLAVKDVATKTVIWRGAGDRSGWKFDLKASTIEMAFISTLAAADPFDLLDANTGNPYDSLPLADAIRLICKATGIEYKADPGAHELNNVSIIRRPTADLAGATYSASHFATAIAVVPNGLAVAVGPYVLFTDGTTWSPLGTVEYFNLGMRFWDSRISGHTWEIPALGYRGGAVHGIATIPETGVAARFTFSATPRASGDFYSYRITASDLFTWWNRTCAIKSKPTVWRLYGGTDSATWYIEAVGHPTPDHSKLGIPKLSGRLTLTLSDLAMEGSTSIVVTNSSGATQTEIGDYLDVKDEYVGAITGKFVGPSKTTFTFERPLQSSYLATSLAYSYAQGRWPSNNVLLPRPSTFSYVYDDPLVKGGESEAPVQVIRRKHQGVGDARFYAPVEYGDAQDALADPGFAAFQAQTELEDYISKTYLSARPRGFTLYVPGNSILPPDIDNGIEYRQTKASDYENQSPVQIYHDGAACENGEADGQVLCATVGSTHWLVWEDINYTGYGSHRYPVLKVGYISSTNKVVRTWRSREPEDPWGGVEAYLASQLVVVGESIYGAALVVERIWEEVEAPVIVVGEDESTKWESGSLPLMLKYAVSELIPAGSIIKFEDGDDCYTVAESVEQTRLIATPSVPWKWPVFGPGHPVLEREGDNICPDAVGYFGPTTTLGLGDVPGIRGGDGGVVEIKNRFCGKNPWVLKKTIPSYRVFKIDNGQLTWIHTHIRNADTPLIDAEYEFKKNDMIGEVLTPDTSETTTPKGWIVFKSANRNPITSSTFAATIGVYVARKPFTTTNISRYSKLPDPTPGTAYYKTNAGDGGDEVWIYLPEGYKHTSVEITFDYYSEIPITAVWNDGATIMYSTRDGYIWRYDTSTSAACIGKLPDNDYINLIEQDTDRTWMLTGAGRLAQYARYHSGSIESAFGGKDLSAPRLLAEIARASNSKIRETGNHIIIREATTAILPIANAVSFIEEPQAPVRAVQINYRGGTYVAGDAKTRPELKATISAELVSTPQHAKVIADAVYALYQENRRRVVLAGISATPWTIAEYDIVSYKGFTLQPIRLTMRENQYHLTARDVTPRQIGQITLPGEAILT